MIIIIKWISYNAYNNKKMREYDYNATRKKLKNWDSRCMVDNIIITKYNNQKISDNFINSVIVFIFSFRK